MEEAAHRAPRTQLLSDFSRGKQGNRSGESKSEKIINNTEKRGPWKKGRSRNGTQSDRAPQERPSSPEGHGTTRSTEQICPLPSRSDFTTGAFTFVRAVPDMVPDHSQPVCHCRGVPTNVETVNDIGNQNKKNKKSQPPRCKRHRAAPRRQPRMA